MSRPLALSLLLFQGCTQPSEPASSRSVDRARDQASFPPLDGTAVGKEPRPVVALEARNLAVSWCSTWASSCISVELEVDLHTELVELSLSSTCQEGDRWYHDLSGGSVTSLELGWRELTIAGRSGRPQAELCQVAVEVVDDRRRRIVGCLQGDQFTRGPCERQPEPGRSSAQAVTVDELHPFDSAFGPAFAAVELTVHPNEPLPERGGAERTTLRSELRCGEGVPMPDDHPLFAHEAWPGVHLRLEALFGTMDGSPIPWPCDLTMTLERDDGVAQDHQVVYRGCLGEDEIVTGRCEERPRSTAKPPAASNPSSAM